MAASVATPTVEQPTLTVGEKLGVLLDVIVPTIAKSVIIRRHRASSRRSYA